MSDDTWEEAVSVLIDGEPVTVATTLEAADCLFRGWPGGTGPTYDATIQAFASVFDELEPADIARSAFLDAIVQTENGMTRVCPSPHLDGVTSSTSETVVGPAPPIYSKSHSQRWSEPKPRPS